MTFDYQTMASRRLVVVPFEMVRPLLEPEVQQSSVLKPTEILRQSLLPATKAALYASALNRQLGIKYPDVAGEVAVPIEEQNKTRDVSPSINSPLASINDYTPRSESPPGIDPSFQTPVQTINPPRRQVSREAPSPRTILQRRLRYYLREFITKENKVLTLRGDVIAGSDATKFIDYVTNSNFTRRAPRGSVSFVGLLREIEIPETIIANEEALKIFKKPLVGVQLNWDDLGYA